MNIFGSDSMIPLLVRDAGNFKSKEQLIERVTSSIEWLNQMSNYCKLNGMTRQAVLKQLLPFNDTTDARDQANIENHGSQGGMKFCDEEMGKLQVGAVETRKLFRVKIADEMDLQQLEEVFKMVKNELKF
jgi:hypothetical protein